MAEQDGDGSSVEAGIDSVENGAGHGNSKVEFVHGGSVGRDDGDDVASLDAGGGKGRGELKASMVSLRPGVGGVGVDDGRRVAVDGGGSFEEAEGSEGGGIGRSWLQLFHGNGYG